MESSLLKMHWAHDTHNTSHTGQTSMYSFGRDFENQACDGCEKADLKKDL